MSKVGGVSKVGAASSVLVFFYLFRHVHNFFAQLALSTFHQRN